MSDLRIIVIGAKGAGKTSYINKWRKSKSYDSYKRNKDSDFGFIIFENKGEFYRIQLWELAVDKNKKVIKIFAKDVHGGIIISDITNEQTREE